MSKISCNTYLTVTLRMLFFILTVTIIFGGCSSSKLIAKKKQFEKMPDKELLSYYLDFARI